MSPAVNRRAMALGGICLLGFGAAGCSRDNGLNLSKQDPRTDTAITERANESILRSKQELAGTKGGSKGAAAAGLAQTDSSTDDKPALASRWKTPFKGAGNLLKRKPAEEKEDPFLVQSPPKSDLNKEAAKVQDSIAALQKEKALEAKAVSAGDKKLATADARTKSQLVDPAKTKAPLSSDSKAALDEFLKSQEPIGVEGRALAAGYEKDALTQKPGTSSKSKKPQSAEPADQSVASNAAAVPGLDHRTLGSRSVASSGAARPFPADFAPASKSSEVATKPTSKLRQTAQAEDNGKLAAAEHQKSVNPLAEEAPKTPSKTKQATGREIAGLLKRAKLAGDRGQLDEAMSYAVAANDLAEQCSYEFAAGEQRPSIVVDWLADKQAEAEQLSAGRSERRQLAAARKQPKNVAALPTSFAKPTAEQFFADETKAAVEETPAPEITVAASSHESTGESSFNEWASTVGKQPVMKSRSPEWPVLSAGELAASDDLWRPSPSTFEQHWPTARHLASRPTSELASAAPRETRLASAETDAPMYVATADARTAAAAPPAIAQDPIVELGQPTDLAPDLHDHRIARADGATTSRRGPRLAAPPPLQIEDGGEIAPSSTRSKGMGRTVWYALIGGLLAVLLFGFRRWAYKPAAEKS